MTGLRRKIEEVMVLGTDCLRLGQIRESLFVEVAFEQRPKVRSKYSEG
jgi:hypothetical protein